MFRRIKNFLKETKTELVDKTTWPTKDAVLNSTVVVIVSIIIVSVGLFAVDMVVSRIVQFVVVGQSANLSRYFNVFTFLGFVVVAVVFAVASARIRKKFE